MVNIASLVFGILFLTGALAAQATDHVQMLNSYVSMKLHLDADASRGQMVGAAWLRIRNTSDTPITEVPFLLNPGLQVTKVLGTSNKPLFETSDVSSISGYDLLKLTSGTVTLAPALGGGKDTEIIIHYRGSLQNLSWSGRDHAKETLSQDFTIIRADSFGYPVLAAANKAAIEATTHQPNYYQTATIELADGYMVAGNLHIDETTLKNDNKVFDLKNTSPIAPMILPIARYQSLTSAPLFVSFLPGGHMAAQTLIDAITPEMQRLQQLLGNPSIPRINITMVPDGYGTISTAGLIMMEQSHFTAKPVKASNALLGLWALNREYPQGQWKNSLNTYLSRVLSTENTNTLQEALFSSVAHALSANPAAGKTVVADLTEKNWNTEADAITSFVFAGLHALLGDENFFAFIRSARNDLRGNYVDNAMFADFVMEAVHDKKARKFAKNWLTGKKANKDLKKASTFSELIANYK